MPYINVSTSAKVNDKSKLLEEISILISSLTNKSRSFVMAKIEDNSQMYFDDTLLTFVGNFLFTKIGNIFFNLKITDRCFFL